MIDKSFPITPPPELLGKWEEDWRHSKVKHCELEDYIAVQAAQWGADQELEACCKWLAWESPNTAEWLNRLRAARRPKPPSLAEQALDAIDEERADITLVNYKVIRAALERLQKLENN